MKNNEQIKNDIKIMLFYMASWWAACMQWNITNDNIYIWVSTTIIALFFLYKWIELQIEHK